MHACTGGYRRVYRKVKILTVEGKEMGEKILLDLGCGCEGYGKYLEKVKGTIGLDIGRGMCDVQGDLHHLPFRDNVADKVNMRAVLEGHTDPFIAFREAYRVLKDAGSLHVETPNCYDIIKIIRLFKGRHAKGYNDPRGYKFAFGRSELGSLLTFIGFKVQKVYGRYDWRWNVQFGWLYACMPSRFRNMVCADAMKKRSVRDDDI